MTTPNSANFKFSFPAIRGIQAGREYYVTMCPLGLVPKLLRLDDERLLPEHRAQRILNKGRLPQIIQYILKNPANYVLSSLTASVDGEVQFEPCAGDGTGRKLGMLIVPMDARVLINDGQHRMAAIEGALQKKPSLANEAISIVLFVDAGLDRSQQMFADLNRFPVRPTRSLGILYDHRDPTAKLARKLAETVPVFKGMTEAARSAISNRSRKLFTLSSIYQATRRFLSKKTGDDISPAEERLATEFWVEVAKQVPDWRAAVDQKVHSSELRRDYIHAHGIALQAFAIAGASLVTARPRTWQKELAKLKKVDWSRQKADLWEGRALIGGRLNKAQNNVILTANVLKNTLGLSLSPTEIKVERLYEQGRHNAR